MTTTTQIDAMSPHWLYAPEEALAQPWMADAPWSKSSDGDYHRIAVRTSKWISYSRTDLAWVNGSFESVLFYGDSRDGTGFTGASLIYGTIDQTLAQNAVNVIDGHSRSSDRTSVWLFGWGPSTIYMVSESGLPPNGRAAAKVAIVCQDWRYAARICNLDPVNGDIKNCMDRALLRLPLARGSVRSVFYMNRDARAQLSSDTYRNIPIRVIDAIRMDEAKVL